MRNIKLRQSSASNHKSTSTNEVSVYPGDDIIPNALMVYDRFALLNASPETIWPWVVQVGKRRGGWYLMRRYEQCLPSSWRATRTIEPQWQNIASGDRVPDYGGQQDYLEVVTIEAPRALIYRSERYGTTFSWALLLSQEGTRTKLHLRFRGGLQSQGLRRRALIAGGHLLDWMSTAPMLAGLAERVEPQ